MFGPPNGTPSPEVVADVRKHDNAALIARAVTTLDEAKAVLRQIEQWAEQGGSQSDYAWYAHLQAALAKMEGTHDTN